MTPAGGVAAHDLPARVDASDKATGAARYVADHAADDTLHATVVRSTVPHGWLRHVDSTVAITVPGVIAVLTAKDFDLGLAGRRVRDIPVLCSDKVRFVGDRVAVVVATSRAAAEQGALAVSVDYEELPPVCDPEQALAPDAPTVHDAPWAYAGAVVAQDDHPNLQSEVRIGDPAAVDHALARATHVVEQTYRTPAGPPGYLEPQAWLAVPDADGAVRLWATTKSPYRLRQQIAECLDDDPELIDIEPALIGGDFGGKGAIGEAPLCVALARRFGRPVRIALRSGEDLTATSARHPSAVRVRLGCDADGQFVGLAVDALFAGGAYAGVKPRASVDLHGAAEAALGYRFPSFAIRSRIVYTTTLPKGHVRAPGAPQTVFAVERAVDELAVAAGIDPVEIRRRNLLHTGEPDAYGHQWPEARGVATLDAAVAASVPVEVPARWSVGRGVAVYARPTSPPAETSLRLSRNGSGTFVVEVPVPETGTGSHSVVQVQVARALGVPPDQVEVRQSPTGSLGYDPGVGGSRVTVGMSAAVDRLIRAWLTTEQDRPVTIDGPATGSTPGALATCAQMAVVAVDPETGQVRVVHLVSAVDVADIVRPASHQMQIDGGAVMGYGFACLEDLMEADGQIWAAHLGELKLPCAADVPQLTTVLVPGGIGVGPANVKSVGELTNVPTAAAIANAVADATGVQLRSLPITAARVYQALGELRGTTGPAEHPTRPHACDLERDSGGTQP